MALHHDEEEGHMSPPKLSHLDPVLSFSQVHDKEHKS